MAFNKLIPDLSAFLSSTKIFGFDSIRVQYHKKRQILRKSDKNGQKANEISFNGF